MTSSVFALWVDANDPLRLARFWAGVLGWEMTGGSQFRATADLIPSSQLSMFPRRGHISVARDRHAVAQIAGFLTWERPVTNKTTTD